MNCLKICQDRHPELAQWGVEFIVVQRSEDRLLVGDLGIVGWGGNSGFHAINLAVQFGVKKIILIGYDMRIDKGVHWHGDHTGLLNNPNSRNVERWRRAVDNAAELLKALNIEVVNVSPVSALSSYPIMSLERALEC